MASPWALNLLYEPHCCESLVNAPGTWFDQAGFSRLPFFMPWRS